MNLVMSWPFCRLAASLLKSPVTVFAKAPEASSDATTRGASRRDIFTLSVIDGINVI